MYFNFVVLLLLSSPTIALVSFFVFNFSSKSTTSLSKLCTTITDQHKIAPTLILTHPQTLLKVLMATVIPTNINSCEIYLAIVIFT